MRKKIYLISYVGDGVPTFSGKLIIGFINKFNIVALAHIVKKRNNLTLGIQAPVFDHERGVHWEFITNQANVRVNVDATCNLDVLLTELSQQ